VKIPLGDILRALLPWNWLKKTKGISINVGDHEILLNQQDGPAKPGESKFDSTPHRPAPPRLGGRG
jgi:hypothetical protein